LREELIKEIRGCTHCLQYLPDGVNPVLSAYAESKIAIIGQATGRIFHRSGVPLDDKSGDKLRIGLELNRRNFIHQKILL
jgi:uracil-DNA glycosylase